MISIYDEWAKNYYEGRKPVSFIESQYHLHLALTGLKRRVNVTALRAYQRLAKILCKGW